MNEKTPEQLSNLLYDQKIPVISINLIPDRAQIFFFFISFWCLIWDSSLPLEHEIIHRNSIDLLKEHQKLSKSNPLTKVIIRRSLIYHEVSLVTGKIVLRANSI